jgi:hypothetical protein
MGSMYPVNILRADESVDREGFVQFTDADNQPVPAGDPTELDDLTVTGTLAHTGTEAGFFSATPVAQGDAITAVVTTTPALTSYGFTLAQAEAIIANLNTVTALLASLGFVAAS